MKKILCILVVSIFLLQSGVLTLYYQFEQANVKREMEQELNDPEAKFQKLTLSLSDFKRSCLNEKELSIDGRIYDIKSKTIRGNRVELTVLNDSKEENIVDSMRKAEKENEQNKNLVKLLTLTYILPAKQSFFLQQNKVVYKIVAEKILSSPRLIFSPPPRLS